MLQSSSVRTPPPGRRQQQTSSRPIRVEWPSTGPRRTMVAATARGLPRRRALRSETRSTPSGPRWPPPEVDPARILSFKIRSRPSKSTCKKTMDRFPFHFSISNVSRRQGMRGKKWASDAPLHFLRWVKILGSRTSSPSQVSPLAS